MVFDAKRYGNLLISLRIRRGFNRRSFAEAVTDAGFALSYKSLGTIERGEQLATVDRHLVFCLLLNPDPGHFEEALIPDETTGGE